jgi:Aspartyl/Asparaginyl beta-hydroxylase
MGLGEEGRLREWDDSAAVALIGFLRFEGAAELAHGGGRTLLDHLLGTYTIMRRWDQPVWLAHAALIHSVYGTEAYDPQLVSSTRRDDIAAAAGARAERLAHLFCVTPRRLLFAGTHLWARDLPTRSTGDRSTANGGDPATRDELDALLILHMANIAEQARAADGSPGRWLARCDALSELLVDSDTVTPPLFAAQLAAFGEADERLVRRAYLDGLSENGEARANAMALAAAVCPVVPEPCVWLAQLSRCRGDAVSSRSWTAQARRRLSALGTSWDKRLTFEEWLALIEALDRSAEAGPSPGSRAATDPRALFEVLVGHGTAARSQPIERPAIAPPDAATGRKRFQRYIEGLADDGGPSSGAIYPDLPSRPWHEPGDFPLVGYLESNFEEIRDEILALEADRFHRESERIGRTGDWDVAFLYERGRRHDDTCTACPVTARGIETHPTIRTVAGLIYVSRLRAGTHISAHRGPTNLRVRCHLAVRVPEGDCAIRVGEQTRRWQERKCLVFDDYFDHEAWNHAEDDRIVLIVDLWHPGLTSIEVSLLEALHGYTYFHARRLSRYWSANARAARRSGPSAAPET